MRRRTPSLPVALSLATAPAMAERTDQFTGASGHITCGEVTLGSTDAGWEVRLAEDFSFDGAPDPRIGFGQGGTFVDGTDRASLQKTTGAKVCAGPEGIDPAGFDTLVLWCNQFSVPLGIAAIE